MSVVPTEHRLKAIAEEALDLAQLRLAMMNEAQDAIEFDRGARSVGVLLRVTQQVCSLSREVEKDAAAHDVTPEPAPLTPARLAQIRQDVAQQLARIDTAENHEADD